MRTLPPAKFFHRAVGGFAILGVAGCAVLFAPTIPTETPAPLAPAHEHCPAKFSFHYVDSTHGFSLCLPAKVTKGDASSYPSGSVLFNGFAVPKGTNLVTKRLIIVPGTDPDMQAGTADGSFVSDGVTFARMQAGDGSAGHLTQFIIYTWTHGGQTFHFDFSLYSANVNDFPASSRPLEFDLPAQVKFTEEVMKTFRRLH
jgi:hypothetical protein